LVAAAAIIVSGRPREAALAGRRRWGCPRGHEWSVGLRRAWVRAAPRRRLVDPDLGGKRRRRRQAADEALGVRGVRRRQHDGA